MFASMNVFILIIDVLQQNVKFKIYIDIILNTVMNILLLLANNSFSAWDFFFGLIPTQTQANKEGVIKVMKKNVLNIFLLTFGLNTLMMISVFSHPVVEGTDWRLEFLL